MTDEPDDAADDQSAPASFGSLLPPEDRIWRHPSEITGDSPRSARGPSWGTAAFSAVGGALAVGALWLAVGNGDSRLVTEKVSLVPIDTVLPRIVDADEWAGAVTATARNGTVEVRPWAGASAVAGAIVYRDDGYLLTSARAVDGLESMVVITPDGETHAASVVGSDHYTDVSVIHVDQTLVPVVVAAADTLESGDRIAIVDPDGRTVESSVADSASRIAAADGGLLVGLVRLDTALGDVPPGSPVVDDTGAVVGMTTATGPNESAALVPIDVARAVAVDLIERGVARHSWLGVTARDVTDDEIAARRPAGALVTAITADGPAARGGILTDDVIVSVGMVTVDSLPAVVSALRYHEPGDLVEVLIERDGETISTSVVLGELEGTPS